MTCRCSSSSPSAPVRFTLGATAIDVTSDTRDQQRYAQVQTTSQQATVYATMDDCVRAMAQQNLPASNCQQR